MIQGNKYTAMICDRDHPNNGTMQAYFGPVMRYNIYSTLPPLYADLNDASLDVPIRKVELHYGTFNGVPVWTREKVET